MSKFDLLRKPSAIDIYAPRLQSMITTVTTVGKIHVAIHGYPDCPECGHEIEKGYCSDRWVCVMCKTVWTTSSLAEAIINEDTQMRTSIRNMEVV